MTKYYHPMTDFFAKRNLPVPSAEVHGDDEDFKLHAKKLMPNSWVLEGNLLKGQTEMGELVQTIPTDYICKGTDSKGLPIFEKVVL